MNRADLSWALNATLPHIGKRTPFDKLTLQGEAGRLFAYATDAYTFGMARIPDAPSLHVALSQSEATDLMRFVRPTVKATQTEEVIVAVRGTELHVALVNADGQSYDSAVFETDHPTTNLDYWISYCALLWQAVPEFTNCVYDPDLCQRFSKARRLDGDRLRIYPRSGDLIGRAIVTVGPDFIGAIAGMTYEHDDGYGTVESFLGSLEERRTA